MSEPLRAPTVNGSLALSSIADGQPCATCDRAAAVAVDVYRLGGRTSSVCLCGTCIAEGLAILLGRRHVQAGGSVDELRATPPG